MSTVLADNDLREQAAAPRAGWSLENIDDEGFRGRFVTVPDIVNMWVSEHVALEGAEVMDFGCGEAIAALAMVLRYKVKRIVGVDIMPDYLQCLPWSRSQIGIEALPPQLQLHRVEPGFLHDPRDRFDVIYSWSVLEHVDQRIVVDTLRLVKAALKPGGVFMAQIAPLYYSSEGGHLFHRLPEHWGHLLTQDDVYYERLERAVRAAHPRAARSPDPWAAAERVRPLWFTPAQGVDPADEELRILWSMYRTLNRMTVPQLLQSFRDAGFEIVKTYTTQDGPEPCERLKAIYQEEALKTNQVVVLAR